MSTVNRFRNHTLMKTDRRMNRGDVDELIGCTENGVQKVVVTKLKDNKSVYLASSCSGKTPVQTVGRWNKPTNPGLMYGVL